MLLVKKEEGLEGVNGWRICAPPHQCVSLSPLWGDLVKGLAAGSQMDE